MLIIIRTFAQKITMNNYIRRIITFLSILILISIQFIWLYNSYLFAKNDIIMQTSNLLETAINEETFSRLSSLPQGTMVKSRPQSDSGKDIPEFAYMQESLNELGYPMSLDSVAKMFKQILKEKKINNDFSLSVLNKNRIIKKLGRTKHSIFNINTKQIPIKEDYSYTLEATIINPHVLFFQKMGILLLSTTILIVFVLYSIIYQIRIISRINKISQIREDFSYAMVHDMKTPLSSILSALNFLQGGRLDNKPEMKEKFFNIAKDEADHLLTLTNKILTISKLENNKLEMNCEIVMLESLLVKLSEKFKAKSPKPVTFKFDLKAESIYADAEYIEEVFCNMIDNSIKYSKDSVDIKISSSENSKYSIIKIYDNGLGMNEDDQLKIFNKYERAYAGRKKKTYASGFGLGLNFVQQVIEAHKGKIIVNSVEGEFTEFIIYLPLILKEL